MPQVRVLPDAAAIGGGMDAGISPLFAKAGTARLAYNYEYSVSGGANRLGGIEPFDGQPSPSEATYVMLQCTEDVAGIALGDTLDGATSGASGLVIYISDDMIAVTRVAGQFAVEDLEVSAVVKAVVLSTTPAIDGFTDNVVAKLAADEYQTVIAKVPGVGPIRGIAGLNGVLYAWRNNAGNTAMDIYKSTAAGWEAITLHHELSFTLGTSVYAEASTITQGGTSAVVKRVVLESGAWASGTAAGRLIVAAPTGGVFSGGAAAGGGACTLSGASAQIVLAPDGDVDTDTFTFTAALADKRMYGCDGVNPEFEFDGTIYVPLNTGMGSIRATTVKCHKSHLFFGYRGSLQHSAIGNPYVWSAVFGAAELGTGDEITNLVSVGGSTDAAALMVLCRNALWMLYGTSTIDWNMTPQSRVSGAMPRSAVDIGGVVALDNPGVVRYPATQSFGNFAWDTVSMAIQSVARNKECSCAVYVPAAFKYRLFFADGTAISGMPTGKGKFDWSVINYGRNILYAESFEIDGVARTFYAGDDGWVYEADKGRSFAGDPIPYAMKLHSLSQRSPMVDKTYRQMQLELKAESACTLYTSGEFGNADDEGPTQQTITPKYGAGLFYELANYDESYWEVSELARKTMPLEGYGNSVSITVAGESDNELPHTLRAVTVLYTPRKIVR